MSRRSFLLGLALLGMPSCLDEPPALGAAPPPPPDERLLVLPPLVECDPSAAPDDRIRVATWNMSAARLAPLEVVGQVLADIDADVVLLQEVDVGTNRSGETDQAQVLGEMLGMQHAFAASIEFDGGDFGLAVLTRLPMSRAERVSLDSEGGHEVRVAFDFTVCAGPRWVRLIDMHADFITEVNVRNLTDLAEHLGPLTAGPTVIGGDLNAPPESEGVSTLRSITGAVDVMATWDPGPTRQGERIDYLLADPQLRVVDARRVVSEASDHALLWADLDLSL